MAAYRTGLFPMPVGRRNRIGWWSPDPRAVIPVHGFHTSRSLHRAAGRFDIRVDSAFETVMRACADPRRPHGWINEDFILSYVGLHELGWAHSVEAWQDDQLVGGVYGVSIGAFFAGESMFHTATDASKVALRALVELLGGVPHALFDVQWLTPHLESLGALEIPRDSYVDLLRSATAQLHGPFW